MSDKPYNVLFLSTGNSARSIMAEVLLNSLGGDRFRAYSAGSHPAGQVHPYAIQLLEKNNLSTEGLRSKDWKELTLADTPALDFVFTVCDDDAGEVCPVWPGQPISAHWGVPDPAEAEGGDEEKQKAFLQAFSQLQHRIALFVNLPIDKLDRIALKTRLERIGKEANQ